MKIKRAPGLMPLPYTIELSDEEFLLVRYALFLAETGEEITAKKYGKDDPELRKSAEENARQLEKLCDEFNRNLPPDIYGGRTERREDDTEADVDRREEAEGELPEKPADRIQRGQRDDVRGDGR